MGLWNFGTSHTWLIPDPGHKGYIQSVSTGEVLGLLNDVSTSDTKIILETSNADVTDKQLWLRGVADNGYFTLTNIDSGKFMFAESTTSTILRGNKFIYFHSLHKSINYFVY